MIILPQVLTVFWWIMKQIIGMYTNTFVWLHHVEIEFSIETKIFFFQTFSTKGVALIHGY